ncbi:MAG: hypothetical protein AAGI17_05430 [Planctomycetota bacterium]
MNREHAENETASRTQRQSVWPVLLVLGLLAVNAAAIPAAAAVAGSQRIAETLTHARETDARRVELVEPALDAAASAAETIAADRAGFVRGPAAGRETGLSPPARA